MDKCLCFLLVNRSVVHGAERPQKQISKQRKIQDYVHCILPMMISQVIDVSRTEAVERNVVN